MTCLRYTPAHIRVSNHSHLVSAWHHYGDALVGSYICEAALTPSQLRKLPKSLRAMLQHGVTAE